jgi:hypothetical protein
MYFELGWIATRWKWCSPPVAVAASITGAEPSYTDGVVSNWRASAADLTLVALELGAVNPHSAVAGRSGQATAKLDVHVDAGDGAELLGERVDDW